MKTTDSDERRPPPQEAIGFGEYVASLETRDRERSCPKCKRSIGNEAYLTDDEGLVWHNRCYGIGSIV